MIKIIWFILDLLSFKRVLRKQAEVRKFLSLQFMEIQQRPHVTRASGAGPTTPTLVGPKILPFLIKALYFQSFGRTNNFNRVQNMTHPSVVPFDISKQLSIVKEQKQGIFLNKDVY